MKRLALTLVEFAAMMYYRDETDEPNAATLVLGFSDESAAKNFAKILHDYIFRTDGTVTVIPVGAVGPFDFESFIISCTKTQKLTFTMKRRDTVSGVTQWILLLTSSLQMDVQNDRVVLPVLDEAIENVRARLLAQIPLWAIKVSPYSFPPFEFIEKRPS